MSQENVDTLRAAYEGLELPLAHLFRFRGEQVDRWHAYVDRAEALNAVGLEQ